MRGRTNLGLRRAKNAIQRAGEICGLGLLTGPRGHNSFMLTTAYFTGGT